MFCSPLHKFGNYPNNEELQRSDIHLISGSAFPILPYLYKNNFSNNIILESPGFIGNLPQFLACYDYNKFDNKKPINSKLFNNLFHTFFVLMIGRKNILNP